MDGDFGGLLSRRVNILVRPKGLFQAVFLQGDYRADLGNVVRDFVLEAVIDNFISAEFDTLLPGQRRADGFFEGGQGCGEYKKKKTQV